MMMGRGWCDGTNKFTMGICADGKIPNYWCRCSSILPMPQQDQRLLSGNQRGLAFGFLTHKGTKKQGKSMRNGQRTKIIRATKACFRFVEAIKSTVFFVFTLEKSQFYVEGLSSFAGVSVTSLWFCLSSSNDHSSCRLLPITSVARFRQPL